jgi:transposase
MPNSIYSHFVGIDVSKSKFDVFLSKNNSSLSFSNDITGIKSLLKAITPCANSVFDFNIQIW